MSELAVQDQAVDPATMELVIVNGDLSKLNPKQRIAWYKARCEAAGLDPRTEPFQYLNLQGKLKLYATKAATDQLISNRKLNVEIIDRRYDQSLGVYEVQCRVTFPDKHSVEDFAALPIKGLVGDNLCNAMMKCVTKAKRRTVLSGCGLGMLDETEVETIPEAREHHAINHDNQTGHGSGAYAEPDDVKAYQGFIESEVVEVNQRWCDRLTNPPDGEVLTEADGEITNTWELSGHLLKWARGLGWVNAPAEIRAGQRDKFCAVAWKDHMNEFMEEARAYFKKKWNEKLRAAKAKAAKAARAQGKREAPEVLTLAEENEAMDALLTTEAGARG